MDEIGWPRLEVSDAEMIEKAEAVKGQSANLGRLVGWFALVIFAGLVILAMSQKAHADEPKFPPADRSSVSRQAVYP